MSAPSKTTTAVLGTYGSPASVAHGGTPVNSTAFDMRTDFGVCINWGVIFGGTSPTVNTTVQPQVSDDNSHWTNDGGAFVIPLTASTTTTGTYIAPNDALYTRLQLVNGDSTIDATAWAYAQATTGVA